MVTTETTIVTTTLETKEIEEDINNAEDLLRVQDHRHRNREEMLETKGQIEQELNQNPPKARVEKKRSTEEEIDG